MMNNERLVFAFHSSFIVHYLKIMFCPKCGTQNPDNGKFCRACGTDLATVSDALAGKQINKTANFGMMQPIQPIQLRNAKGKPVSWESAIVKLFTGLAFLIVSLILSFSQMGRGWWFWMLIPAFSVLGGGVAQIVQLKKTASANQFQMPENENPQLNQADFERVEELVNAGRKKEAVKVYREVSGRGLKEAKDAIERIEGGRMYIDSPIQTENQYNNPQKSIYDTGEFPAVPSVTEGTTRHLEINNEGETMTLPPNNK